MIFPKITLTMTTCKRLQLFKQTIQLFFNNCLDIDLIKEIIIVDDNSSLDDIKEMQNFLKDYKYNIKLISTNCGHANALNILFYNVQTDYIFHLEDDWEIKKGNFIRQSFEIMNDNEKIKSVLMRNWIAQGAKQQIPKHIEKTKYYIHNYNGLKFQKGNINTYPGYSLNPSLQNIKDIKKIGKFENKKLFELRFAYRYYSYGYLVGMTYFDFCLHVGIQSAYKSNNTEA
jgi:hypothetical protein